jgi:predicted MFS family arabinose efflux permease
MTARDAMLPDVARDTGLSVDRVSGIREALFGASFLVGPALAGIGLALLPDVAVLWLTCGCSALAALLTLGLRNRRGEPVGSSPRAWFEHVREGIGILGRNPVARGTTVLAIGAVLAISPMQGVVLPAFFVKLDAPGLLGLTLCAVAVGLIGGSLLYAPLVRRTSRRAMLVLALVVSLVAFAAFAIVPSVTVVIPAAVLIGFGFGTLNPMFPVLIAERVPEAARGRVLGLQNAGYLAGYPIGVLLAGLIVQGGGVQLGVIVTALIWAGFVTFGLVAPALRSLERPASAAPDPGDPAATGSAAG